MQAAVEKIAQWVIGSLTWVDSSNNNVDQNASEVFDRKTGNCAGYTNLIIAMLRSVHIPARFVSGTLLYHPYHFPLPIAIPPYYSMGESSGLHAIYEVQYPDKGWVMAEPQRTLNFMHTHFVRHNHGPDNCDELATFSYSYTGSTPPTMNPQDMCGTITDFENEYEYDSYSTFEAAKKNKTLLSAAPGFTTGINDKIEITSGTNSFKAGKDVFYNSTFTSIQGNTWPVNTYWSIDLYHTNGIYNYASKDNAFSSWGFTTNPILPDYNWLLDTNGHIFGEVSVVAALNDGDMIGAKMPLSIEECNGVFVSNQTYTSNITITGCYVTINNVSVQNNSSLIVDSEMGVTINGDFNVNVGSLFETK